MGKPSFFGLILVVVFCVLVFGVGLWVGTNSGLLKGLRPERKITPNKSVVEAMVATKNNEQKVNFYLANGDPLYGGWTFQGLVTEVVTKPLPITLNSGEVVGQSRLALKVAYLDKDGQLHSSNLVLAMEFMDGKIFLVDITPFELNDLAGLQTQYKDKVGTLVYAGIRLDTDKVMEALQAANRTQKDIDDAQKLFDFLKGYEASWGKEFELLADGRLAGQIEYLFPLMYWSSSYGTKLDVQK